MATFSVPASVIVPLLVTGPPDVVRPVVPPLTSILVTVPAPLVGDEIVKFGYVPVTVVAPEPVRATTWSGAVLVTVMEPDVVTGPPETLTPVPAVKLTLVTVPVFDVKPDGLLAGYAPRFVSAVGALVAPVPPLAMATVPDVI